MDKATFLDIVNTIVQGFEDANFRAQFAAAQASGDVAQMMALPTSVQERAFARHGLTGASGTTAFKEAGRNFALDADVGPLLTRMKQALK